MMNIKINFSKFFKIANIFSTLIILISLLFLVLKGLNYGVDFKGGTLLEIRISDNNIKIQDLRNSLNTDELGDVSVKQFGKEGDFLVKFEKDLNENKKFISELKESISKKNFNRSEFQKS